MDAEPDYGLDTITTIHVLSGYQRRLDEIVKEENTMTRLTDKMASSVGIVQAREAKIEARLDALIALDASLDGKTDKAFSPYEQRLGSNFKSLQEMEDALRLFDNGGPLLSDTGSSDPTQP